MTACHGNRMLWCQPLKYAKMVSTFKWANSSLNSPINCLNLAWQAPSSTIVNHNLHFEKFKVREIENGVPLGNQLSKGPSFCSAFCYNYTMKIYIIINIFSVRFHEKFSAIFLKMMIIDNLIVWLVRDEVPNNVGERKKPDEERFSRMIHKSLLESIYYNFVIGSKIVFPENIELERHFCKKKIGAI